MFEGTTFSSICSALATEGGLFEGISTWVVWAVAAVVFVFFLLLVVIFKRYQKVGPNEALIISGGLTGRVPKVIKGGGGFVWPFVQKAEILSLEVITIDVRTPEEWEMARIEAAELLDYNQSEKYMGLPKDRKIVFSCHSGVRSLDVASYFIGHGFAEVYSMRGGITAWSDQVDPSVPKY